MGAMKGETTVVGKATMKSKDWLYIDIKAQPSTPQTAFTTIDAGVEQVLLVLAALCKM